MLLFYIILINYYYISLLYTYSIPLFMTTVFTPATFIYPIFSGDPPVLSFRALALGSMKVAATALVQCWRWLTVARGIGSMLLLAALAQCCCWQHWLNLVAGSIGSMLLLAALAQCCCWQRWLTVVVA